MSEPNPETASVSAAPTDSTEEYRALSPAALAAVGWSAISLLAFAHPLLEFVPWVGVVVAAIALRQIYQPDSLFTGARLAKLGLLVSLVIAVAAPMRTLSRSFLLRREAIKISKQWLELVQQRQLPLAYEMHLPFSSRHPTGTNLGEHYATVPSAKAEMEKFFQNKALAKLAAAGEQSEIRFPSQVGVFVNESSNSLVVVLNFEIVLESETLPCKILVRRKTEEANTANWEVSDVAIFGKV